MVMTITAHAVFAQLNLSIGSFVCRCLQEEHSQAWVLTVCQLILHLSYGAVCDLSIYQRAFSTDAAMLFIPTQ